MMTATEMKTGEFMGRTGEDHRHSSLPEDYSISTECGVFVLRYKSIVMFGVLDPTANEEGDAAASRNALAARQETEHHLREAANHHEEARRLLARELHEYRYCPKTKAEATARRRLACRDAYYGALEAASGTKG